MPPQQSLCPECGRRPRRKPGAPCRECYQAWQRENRAKHRRGETPLGRNRAVETPDEQRHARTFTKQRFLITSAQNATPVHGPFFDTLERAAKFYDAELVVVPLRYKNPTSIWSAKQDHDEWWDARVTPYLFNVRRKLNPNLVLVADVKIQPTASSPLSGFEALTGAESCLIGHPKMQFKTVAAPTGRYPKILSTTGSCTRRNYTDTKAGALGEFHHFLGAVIVEVDGKWFNLRQLNADRTSGEFTDVHLHFTPHAVKLAPRALALECGDTHALFADPKVDEATFGSGGIVEAVNPLKVLFNDLFDGYSINPHHAGNPFIAQAKAKARFGNVQAEVEHAVRFVVDRCGGRQAVIKSSNHDDFLARWLGATDWRASPGNARFYLETALHLVDSAKMTAQGAEYADPFAYWVDRLRGKANIRCLKLGESLQIAGVECGLHGHRGPNGAKGSVKNLARVGARMNTGHGHAPAIEEGHYRCGTSTPLEFEYTRGSPSSWLNTHIVIYASGKRALITTVATKWRLPPPPLARGKS